MKGLLASLAFLLGVLNKEKAFQTPEFMIIGTLPLLFKGRVGDGFMR
jgi:hypothetical protein